MTSESIAFLCSMLSARRLTKEGFDGFDETVLTASGDRSGCRAPECLRRLIEEILQHGIYDQCRGDEYDDIDDNAVRKRDREYLLVYSVGPGLTGDYSASGRFVNTSHVQRSHADCVQYDRSERPVRLRLQCVRAR